MFDSKYVFEGSGFVISGFSAPSISFVTPTCAPSCAPTPCGGGCADNQACVSSDEVYDCMYSMSPSPFSLQSLSLSPVFFFSSPLSPPPTLFFFLCFFFAPFSLLSHSSFPLLFSLQGAATMFIAMKRAPAVTMEGLLFATRVCVGISIFLSRSS